jgi:FkbM family methyltransferase
MRYYGQWKPPVDQVLHESYFSGKKNGVFIECGAFDGVDSSCCLFFEKFMGWRGVNIEPLPYAYDALCKNRPRATNVKVALSSKNGVSGFTQAYHPRLKRRFGNGSLSHTKEHKAQLVKTGCTFETFEVETITFKTLVDRLQLDKLDLFVLDVEGHERDVVMGMRGASVLPRVACIEFPSVPDLEEIMGELGYKLHQKMHNNAYFVRI